jgi:uncharacterized membrane protein HdeD (DUF308 family)
MGVTEQRMREAGSRLTSGLIVRGVVAILFGIVLLLWPGISLGTLVLMFGAYSLVDGVVAISTAATSARKGERWWLVLHGLAGIAAGVVAFVWTGLSALALLYVIGTWAIVLGTVEFAAALSGRGDGSDRFMLGLHGVLGVAFGVVMWWRPGAGALALITLIATFAIVTGVMRIATAIQLRNRGEAVAAALFPPSAEARA